ncbi:PE-PPE domain-containing protein [Mycolicibacterium chubuense NBB4]|uniref:PE-PPE domain-containing protein n=1 Tax=Mycolicibacterium chubuense (strain NBB4) TaxID=710421 RepID=I4BE53_MYCCN|nr:PE-PPE domain-containing protein [Mycolicibacterium chubuense]AFM15560.1 PE-PPE domain-containing protein [Mycolicibacterium chubuense NBB4]
MTPRQAGAGRRSTAVKATACAFGVASMAVAGAALIGAAPTLTASPQLLATLHYLRGTNIGWIPTQQQYEDFIGVALDGTGTPAPDAPYEEVPYNAGFRPFSHGGFKDLTFDQSVAQGVQNLEAQQPAAGDLIFGFSQGAVVASQYKKTHTGNTYVLVENPSRPNGGVMERFQGLTIPFLGVTFSGATPNNGVDGAPGDPTIDIARQYDGWADFPTYLWNPLAVANAVAGMVLVHGNTQTELTAADLAAAQAAGSDYYQHDAASNTTYYLIKTYPVPLLIPLEHILPAPVIAALDKPLRDIIETAYDRSDYSKPTRATFFPRVKPAPQTETVDAATSAPVAADPVAGTHSLVAQKTTTQKTTTQKSEVQETAVQKTAAKPAEEAPSDGAAQEQSASDDAPSARLRPTTRERRHDVSTPQDEQTNRSSKSAASQVKSDDDGSGGAGGGGDEPSSRARGERSSGATDSGTAARKTGSAA